MDQEKNLLKKVTVTKLSEAHINELIRQFGKPEIKEISQEVSEVQVTITLELSFSPEVKVQMRTITSETKTVHDYTMVRFED